ncbi:MAG: efflux RND transporter permease subunit [Microbacterium sp.]
MSKLAVFSLRNRALIALITICAALFGGFALTNLKQELIPSLELPALVVLTTYPGASPEVVEADVSTPIEQAIQGVPDLDETSATSTTNSSIVQATFAYGTDLARAESKMEQAINRISSTLPDSVDPQVLSISIDDFPVIQVAVTGYDDADAAQQQLENNIVPTLEDVDGVNGAELIGGVGQRITITPDQAALAGADLTQSAITDALDQNGVLFPGGDITDDDQTLTVQSGSKITSVDELKALPIVGAAETTTIDDVADVELTDDPITSISRVDGKDALSISITKLPAANTVEVSDGVNTTLDDLRQKFPDLDFTIVFDQAPYITQSIESLATEGLLGLAFAVIVILVFLLSVRSTLVTAISIPTSVLITFVGMMAFGYSLNLLTLGALTISIGRVVDDSIVVIENIKRHYVGGADKGDAIRLAVREVAAAVTASTITTVAVFLPIAFVGDIVGELFRPFALTVALAMAASLFVALTIVPVLAFWFMRPGKPVIGTDGLPVDPEDPAAPPTRLQRAYRPILGWTLNHGVVTLLIAVVVLGATLWSAQFMKVNFLGDSGQNTMTISQDLGNTASLDAKSDAAREVEKVLLDTPGIDTVQASIGSSGSALQDAFAGGAGVTYSITTDESYDQEKLRADVQKKLDALKDAGEVTISASEGLGSSDIEISVSAASSDDLSDAADAILDQLKGRDGIGDVTSDLSDDLDYIAVQVDREKAAAAGFSEAAIGGMVSAAMQPQQAGSIEIDNASITIYIASDDPPTTVDELKQLDIPTAAGIIQLEDVADVEQSTTATSITTVKGQRTATITVPMTTDNLTTASVSAQAAIDDAKLPASASASVGGVAEDQASSFGQLGLAMLAAILIVYVVMVAAFKSLRQPLLLLVSIPFAATGAILLQIVSGVPLGVASLIGALMLIGIVVTNAIVLVDLVNQYRRRGLSAHDATLTGASMRLRPILMTALATIFALTPMALGITGHGGFISQPLAIVVIGGLVSSTLLTLIVLPTLYNLVEGAKERRAEKRAGGGGAAPRVPEPVEGPSGDDGPVGDDGAAEDAPVGAPVDELPLRRRGRGLPPASPVHH